MSAAFNQNKRTLIERLEWPQGESLHGLLKDARSVLTDMPDDVVAAAARAYSAIRIEHIGNPSRYYVYGANRLLVKRVLMEAQAVWRMKR